MSGTIEKIKDIELKSKERLDNAKVEASTILLNAKKEGQLKYEDIVNKAQAEGKVLIDEATKRGNDRAKPILDKAKHESDKILALNEKDLSKFVDLIVKKVVMVNGNS
ncbi:hypothetical protein SAMN02745245_01704 [Anaerosphaera aminiphila DSM 21120]|uniref:V/A-type H+-transporting ATPase subunit G/H n=1 Tax=Anaerosphaera aminiphila DSM 21120 TaxID=1120995 RepID=A0A1M5UAJ3_9FIRM|nr:hypothetical protein [Anaerosphaera aminiphila]SHH59928.1 hypothetical protein SAMN02745245_01704 [Anaerosphaera aminiphila DSM 21120]